MVLLFASIVLILALFAIYISDKTGMPSLLLFLALGLTANLLGVEFVDYGLADKIGTFALIIIMFYGGFGTNWTMCKPVVKEAVTLSSIGVVLTGLMTGTFVHFALGFDWLEAMLLGSIVASTDYSSVANILVSKNLNLKYKTASILEIESGSNDPAAYTMTMLFLSLVMGSDVSVPMMVLKQIGLGLGMGFLMALIIGRLLRHLNLNKDGLSIVFIFAMAVFTYSFTAVIGGNGYLAAYIFGIIIGNQTFYGKKDIVFFFDGFNELMNIGLFFVLGLLANPESVWKALPLAAATMAFMTFIGRPLVVFGLMKPFKLKFNQLVVLSWAGLRGAAAIAFAIMVVNTGYKFGMDIYSIVFGICFLSSLIQGSTMASLVKKMDMLDPDDTILRTFNYYQDKSSIGFLETTLDKDSELVGTQVKDLNMTFDFIVAKIVRNGKTVVPRGNTVFEEGDTIIFAGTEYFDLFGEELVEFKISLSHDWVGKQIMDLDLDENQLILTVLRDNGRFVTPEGKTNILAGDTLIVLQNENVDFSLGRAEGA